MVKKTFSGPSTIDEFFTIAKESSLNSESNALWIRLVSSSFDNDDEHPITMFTDHTDWLTRRPQLKLLLIALMCNRYT